MPFWGCVGVEKCDTATARATATAAIRARERAMARVGLAWIRCRTSICQTSCFKLAASVAATKTLRRWGRSSKPSKHPPGTRFGTRFLVSNVTEVQEVMNGPPDGRAGLTRRELEVAALVAEGLTNRQIAERLFISERTADGHLEHIREKLGVRSRSQITAWFIEQSRAPAAGLTPVER